MNELNAVLNIFKVVKKRTSMSLIDLLLVTSLLTSSLLSVQPAFTYLKLTIEALEQGVKFVQS